MRPEGVSVPVVPPLHRHQLARLTPAGWAGVLDGAWQDDERDCLSHWAAQGLPLVVTRQPAAPVRAQRIALGLPAPTRWGRRRLALAVPLAQVSYFDEFPQAHEVTRLLRAAARGPWQRLCAGLRALGVVARVHGSHGWQHITGLDHLRVGSDIDLWIAVSDAEQADAVAALLQGCGIARPRIDGELVCAGGDAVAWREWLAWRRGEARAVLVKRLDGVALSTQPLAQWSSCMEAQAA